MKRLLQLIVTTSVFVIAACAQDITPVIQVDNPPNTPGQQAKHYVILVSLDGFRYDYATKYGAPHIQSMASAGASAPMACCRPTPRSPSRTISRSSPASIPNITASSPTAFMIPPVTTPTSTPNRSRTATAPGTAAHPSGRSPSSRACARRASSGLAPKQRSPASGPRII